MSALQTTKQFYPPLLNPKEVDYSTIDSNIALELRLPPKANYKFVFIRYGLSGGAAMSDFLPNSNIIEADYKQCLKIQKSQDNICFYINHLWRREEAYLNKTLCTLKPNDSILILVRDPISRIKTACNHGWFKHGRNYDHIVKFGITDDIYKVIDSIGFYNEDGKLISNHAFAYNSFIDYIIGLSSFAYYSNIAPLFKDSNITYLDMQEIMPDKAFDTMTRLAKKFNFTLPNEKDKDFYTAIRFNETFYILPLVCVIDLNNNQKVKIHIVSKQQESNVSININRIIFSTDNPLLEKVSFSMSEYDLKALQEDKETLDKVKTYMQDFLIELQKRTDYIKRNKKHENDVLEIFRGDRDLCKKFKAMLDKELIHIKTHRPDIVASWKYYQEFEKICKEVGI